MSESFPIHSLQNILNSAVIRTFSNASAVIEGLIVTGVFQESQEIADVGAIGMTIIRPTFLLKNADLPSEIIGNTVQIQYNDYQIVDKKPDSNGLTLLILEKTE